MVVCFKLDIVIIEREPVKFVGVRIPKFPKFGVNVVGASGFAGG